MESVVFTNALHDEYVDELIQRGSLTFGFPVRLAGGPVLIALGGRPYDVGLVIAATILLNVGVIPLLILCLGLFGVV